MLLKWSIIFLVIAILSGIFGLTKAEGIAAKIAWILFVVFIIVFIISLIF